MMKKYLRRHGDTFVKSHGPSVERDWRHVKALAELTTTIPGLCTAEPLALDRERQRITYRWLGNLPRMITLPAGRLKDTIAVLGGGLARIHEQGIRCPSLERVTDPAVFPLQGFGMDERALRDLDARLPVGLFHGDCWHGNVLIDDSGDSVLIDPIQSPWLFGRDRFLLANGVVDLATMHMSLIVSFRLLPLLRLDLNRQTELGDILLESYLQRFDAMALRPLALRLSRAIANQYISSYPVRINVLVGWMKRSLSRKIIADVDTKLAW